MAEATAAQDVKSGAYYAFVVITKKDGKDGKVVKEGPYKVKRFDQVPNVKEQDQLISDAMDYVRANNQTGYFEFTPLCTFMANPPIAVIAVPKTEPCPQAMALPTWPYSCVLPECAHSICIQARKSTPANHLLKRVEYHRRHDADGMALTVQEQQIQLAHEQHMHEAAIGYLTGVICNANPASPSPNTLNSDYKEQQSAFERAIEAVARSSTVSPNEKRRLTDVRKRLGKRATGYCDPTDRAG